MTKILGRLGAAITGVVTPMVPICLNVVKCHRTGCTVRTDSCSTEWAETFDYCDMYTGEYCGGMYKTCCTP